MLTCKVGKKEVNTIDYTDEQLRKWHEKNILKCPYCNYGMDYRHGEIKVAYFAHKPNSDCTIEVIGSEPETDEHRQSIKDIYLYLKSQKGVSDVILESWIPETRQRPDITFIYKKQKYAIEVQCSPVSTEYLERHRLYKLSGIKDIWILGMDKYKDNFTTDGYYKTKTIERQLIYSEDQNLMYYDCNSKKIKIINESGAEAILDRKTTFELDIKEKKLNDLVVDDIITETYYTQNVNTIAKLFNNNIQIQCDIFESNYYIKSLNKRVLYYFTIQNKKYVIDYINEYLHIEKYNEIEKEYMDIGIKPFIFLNYDLYKGIKENISYNDDWYTKGYNSLELEQCIDTNMLFVYKNKIKLFTYKDNKSNIDNLIKNSIERFKILWSERCNYVLYKKNDLNIDIEKLKCTTKKVVPNAIKYLNNNSADIIFQSFDAEEIVFDNNTIINKSINNKKYINDKEQDIYNKLLSENMNFVQEYIDKINNEIEENNLYFNDFKYKIKNIFENNKDKIIKYDLNYSYVSKDDKGNNVNYDNLIYFKDENQQYIIYSDCEYLHNINGTGLIYDDNNEDISFIKIYNIKKLVDNNFVLYKNYYNNLEIEPIEDIHINIKYKYPEIFNGKNINLFYHHNHKRIKIDIKYNYLPRYNFVDFIDKFNQLQNDIDNYKNKIKNKILKNIDAYKIYSDNDFNIQVSNDYIDKNINNMLYPIKTLMKNTDDETVNIMLNPVFTIYKDKFRLWLIRDFIEVLNDFNIENITNIKDDYYEVKEAENINEKDKSI